ncbi:hypothetical protein [Geminicoccus harenae]|uniref:hypothetical protein n=1 Tax=Geminicoccus harenae TaxID=2498453 RepID=UPI00168ACC6F|nr:hypothetical protein [Geminicoccus harenae]
MAKALSIDRREREPVARAGTDTGGSPQLGWLSSSRRSTHVEAQGGLLRELLEATPGPTTEELRTALTARAATALGAAPGSGSSAVSA